MSANAAGFNFADALTLSVWVYPNNSQQEYSVILDKSHSSPADYTSWVLQQVGSSAGRYYFGYGWGSAYSNTGVSDAGYATYDVYRECAAHGWTALMGDKRATFTHKVKGRRSVERFYSPRRKVVLGRGQSCSVFYWSNLNIKDTLARLRRNQDRDNGPVWEVPDDIDDDYLAQMEGEHRIKKGGKWLLKCLEAGINVKVICGTRTYQEQTALYAKGRTTEGPKVTNAPAGYSWHNFGVGWDFVVFDSTGQPQWGWRKMSLTQGGGHKMRSH